MNQFNQKNILERKACCEICDHWCVTFWGEGLSKHLLTRNRTPRTPQRDSFPHIQLGEPVSSRLICNSINEGDYLLGGLVTPKQTHQQKALP